MDTEVYITDDDLVVVEFHFRSGALKSKVSLWEPTIATEEQWKNLLMAVQNKTRCQLDFYQGNGDGFIRCNGESLIFFAQPSGAGGDFGVEVQIPLNEQCVEILTTVIENPLMQKEWNQRSQ
jgi:hypothetical protein